MDSQSSPPQAFLYVYIGELYLPCASGRLEQANKEGRHIFWVLCFPKYLSSKDVSFVIKINYPDSFEVLPHMR